MNKQQQQQQQQTSQLERAFVSLLKRVGTVERLTPSRISL